MLKHKADGIAAQAGQGAVVQPLHFLPVQPQTAGCGRVHAAEQMQQRCFPRPGRTDNGDKLSFSHIVKLTSESACTVSTPRRYCLPNPCASITTDIVYFLPATVAPRARREAVPTRCPKSWLRAGTGRQRLPPGEQARLWAKTANAPAASFPPVPNRAGPSAHAGHAAHHANLHRFQPDKAKNVRSRRPNRPHHADLPRPLRDRH